MKKLLRSTICYGNSYTVEARYDVCVKNGSRFKYQMCVWGV